MNLPNEQQKHRKTGEEEILIEALTETSPGNTRATLQEAMKKVRRRFGRFSETEAILHMMDSLIVESREKRGW